MCGAFRMIKVFRGDFNHLQKKRRDQNAKKVSFNQSEHKEQTKLSDLIKSA